MWWNCSKRCGGFSAERDCQGEPWAASVGSRWTPGRRRQTVWGIRRHLSTRLPVYSLLDSGWWSSHWLQHWRTTQGDSQYNNTKTVSVLCCVCFQHPRMRPKLLCYRASGWGSWSWWTDIAAFIMFFNEKIIFFSCMDMARLFWLDTVSARVHISSHLTKCHSDWQLTKVTEIIVRRRILWEFFSQMAIDNQ